MSSVSTEAALAAGLVLDLSLDEGAGETVFDGSPSGNDGTLLPPGSGPAWSPGSSGRRR